MQDQTKLIELTMDIKDFSSDWLHCDRISTYVSRMVSHNRADGLLYGNLLNSALNELLETVFKNCGGNGELRCSLERCGGTDSVNLEFPCGQSSLAFYETARQVLARDDVSEIYETALVAQEELSPYLGLLEMTLDYRGKIDIQSNHGLIAISAEFSLDGAV